MLAEPAMLPTAPFADLYSLMVCGGPEVGGLDETTDRPAIATRPLWRPAIRSEDYWITMTGSGADYAMIAANQTSDSAWEGTLRRDQTMAMPDDIEREDIILLPPKREYRVTVRIRRVVRGTPFITPEDAMAIKDDQS